MVATTETGPFYNQVNSDPQPVRAFASTQHNDDCTQTNTFHLSQTVTHTNSYTASLTSTVGMENSLEVKVGIPLVAEVTVRRGGARGGVAGGAWLAGRAGSALAPVLLSLV